MKQSNSKVKYRLKQYVILHVSVVVTKAKHGGLRKQNRSTCHIEHVQHSLLGHVREIYYQSQPVHLQDHCLNSYQESLFITSEPCTAKVDRINLST
ncbi:hypothetical protein DPMN_057887 [Dreissena polymorpha]|uniref:Uncharacterized protein n=1 Tax=Dreissena polymorpha TaxID=45954 RepID=A0A9D4C0Q6_DREPO|nr:hypothetical protein DPMN_057887 [Dreissena polymorpha]